MHFKSLSLVSWAFFLISSILSLFKLYIFIRLMYSHAELKWHPYSGPLRCNIYTKNIEESTTSISRSLWYTYWYFHIHVCKCIKWKTLILLQRRVAWYHMWGDSSPCVEYFAWNTLKWIFFNNNCLSTVVISYCSFIESSGDLTALQF